MNVVVLSRVALLVAALDATVIYKLDGAQGREALIATPDPLQGAAGVPLMLLAALGLSVVLADRRHRQGRADALEARNRALAEPLASRTGEMEAASARLASSMLRDHLTGLGNRRAFGETLECNRAQGQRSRQLFALVMLDVDYFKAYNDTPAHPAVDACLQGVGRVVGESARRPEDMPARYGGSGRGDPASSNRSLASRSTRPGRRRAVLRQAGRSESCRIQSVPAARRGLNNGKG